MQTRDVPVPADPDWGAQNRTLAVFLVSVLGLFLEMMLIRWVSTEIRIFAYLQNTVLIVCFLGLGMGCFTCRQPVAPRQILVPLLTLVTLLSLPLTRAAFGSISERLSFVNDLGMWNHSSSDSPWEIAGQVGLGLGLTFCLMILLWECFVPLGRLLGRLLDDHPHTIWAYSVNVAGSLLGIWLFVLLSAFYLPPAVWILVSAPLLFAFLGTRRERLVNVGLLGLAAVGAWITSGDVAPTQVVWSPYQKLVLFQLESPEGAPPGDHMILVNSVGYQRMFDLSPERVSKDPDIPEEFRGQSQYDIPLLFRPRPERVLIVGAGSGNDVAGALRGGARHVTAVEIDPAIVAMGRAHHAERPYDSRNVRVVVDDARSFFATTPEKYDLIIFGLLDSHTTTAMTNARLDHYVYTRESLVRARELLAEGGVMVLSFEAFKPYIADRMDRALTEVFGHRPLAFRVPDSRAGWGGTLFVTGDPREVQSALARNERLARQVARWQAQYPLALGHTTEVTTDDWPYVYLEDRRIPTLYYLLAVLLLGLLGYARSRLAEPALGFARWGRSHWHFFFLGAAFMLLEVQNISKASVVLGNTWQVNAVIVSGILCMILLSNLIVAFRPRLPQGPVVLGLIGSCVALYFFDLSRLAFLPYATKAVLVGALTTLPMLFSGIIFINSFAGVERKDQALGANLLGALVGGLLQSVTFIIGIKALLLVVAGLYLLAMLTRPVAPMPTARKSQLVRLSTARTDTEPVAS